ncbi:prepilin-type N-terminal cleavage/methylation domain-containing protein [Planococcus kocurii]|uniref:prepilin-type N-terminal cleavage/methylation domain-containing protein n=1 Tax=Planococcus kocurii TaxID=1374 RepID=UPI003CFE46E7
MKKYLQNKLNNEKGMTLIELLAVIVIIAIIAAIAIPAIGNIIENSRFGAAKSDFLNAHSAASLYKADENKLPSLTTVEPKTTLDKLKAGYLDDAGTLTELTFTPDNSNFKIAGTFKINEETYTLEAVTKVELTNMSSSEFKEATK